MAAAYILTHKRTWS